MAYTTEYIDDGHGVLHIGSGIVTGGELIEATAQELQAVRDGLPLCYGLIDFTDIERFAVVADEIRSIARLSVAIAGIIGEARVAIIAPQDVAFGMSRMWAGYAHATAWKTHVFRRRPEAETWLAAPPGD